MMPGIIPVVEKIQTNKKIILAGDKGYIVNDVTEASDGQ